MVLRLSDQYNDNGEPQDDIACQCGRKNCGCGGALPPIIVNVDSNNREGYNTLNPGSIERYAYPVNAQSVYTTPLVQTTTGQVATTANTTQQQKQIVLPVTPKPKRHFFPEFL
jgi:hypothetical protein